MTYLAYRHGMVVVSAKNAPLASPTHCLHSNGCGVVVVAVEPPESIPTRAAPTWRVPVPRSVVSTRLCTSSRRRTGSRGLGTRQQVLRKTGALSGQLAMPGGVLYVKWGNRSPPSLPATVCSTAVGKRTFHSQAANPTADGIASVPRVPWSRPIFMSPRALIERWQFGNTQLPPRWDRDDAWH